jgi:hypothetical protein
LNAYYQSVDETTIRTGTTRHRSQGQSRSHQVQMFVSSVISRFHYSDTPLFEVAEPQARMIRKLQTLVFHRNSSLPKPLPSGVPEQLGLHPGACSKCVPCVTTPASQLSTYLLWGYYANIGLLSIFVEPARVPWLRIETRKTHGVGPCSLNEWQSTPCRYSEPGGIGLGTMSIDASDRSK